MAIILNGWCEGSTGKTYWYWDTVTGNNVSFTQLAAGDFSPADFSSTDFSTNATQESIVTEWQSLGGMPLQNGNYS